MKCYSCGEEIRETSRFCAFCGADQTKRPPEKPTCCHCGQEINPGARFCAFCGGNQSEPPAPAAPVEQEPAIVVVEEPVAAEPAQQIQEEPVVVIPEEPAPEPTPEPAPEPIPEPIAEPTPEPVPEPIPEPAPEPIPEPIAAPIPVAAPPAPEPAPVQQPVYQPQPQPQPQPQYQPYQPQYQPYQPQYQPYQGYWQQPAAAPASTMPAHQLPTGRGMLKMIFLGLITGTLYNMVILSRIAEEINIVASRYDGKRTQQYLWVPFLTALTLGIYVFVWIHGLCNRIGDELHRRNINYKFNASTFWLWNILGSLIFVGPFIYLHKFMKAMNLINRDYNERG